MVAAALSLLFPGLGQYAAGARRRGVLIAIPALVVLTATTPGFALAARAELANVAGSAPLALAGAGMSAKLAEDVGARYLEDDPVTAAALVARGPSGP